MTVREAIDKFIAFFRQQRLAIGQIEALPIYRKILYLVQIDALSRAAFPSEEGHKTRVIKFLNECSNWSERDRVSAIQLQFALEKNGKLSGPLFYLINDRINEWRTRATRIYPIDDLTFEEIQSLACSDVLRIVDEARYDNLLYTYRNFLIHEFREPGKYQFPSEDSSSPFWVEIEDPFTQETSGELVVPLKFLEILCEGSINGLERYLIANNLNPYDSYKFETPWVRS